MQNPALAIQGSGVRRVDFYSPINSTIASLPSLKVPQTMSIAVPIGARTSQIGQFFTSRSGVHPVAITDVIPEVSDTGTHSRVGGHRFHLLQRIREATAFPRVSGRK